MFGYAITVLLKLTDWFCNALRTVVKATRILQTSCLYFAANTSK